MTDDERNHEALFRHAILGDVVSRGSGANSGRNSATMKAWRIAKLNGIHCSPDVGSKTKSFFSPFAGTFASSSVIEIWSRF